MGKYKFHISAHRCIILYESSCYSHIMISKVKSDYTSNENSFPRRSVYGKRNIPYMWAMSLILKRKHEVIF